MIVYFFILFIHVHSICFRKFVTVTSQLSGIRITKISLTTSSFFRLTNYRCTSFCYCFCTLNRFTSRFLRELYLTFISEIRRHTFRFWVAIITTILSQFFKITRFYHKVVLITKYTVSL